jgi:excisionase family DNA binding protein
MTTGDAVRDEDDGIVTDGFADIGGAEKFLTLSRAYIYRLMESGELPYAKFGRARRIPWRALRAFAERSMVGAGR